MWYVCNLFVCLSVYSYLAQILNETLRWAIIGPYAARVQDTDIVIAGHHIPAGVHFTLCQSSLPLLILPSFLADHTAYNVMGYWHDTVICLSVFCNAVHCG